jgi:hypothetical protein
MNFARASVQINLQKFAFRQEPDELPFQLQYRLRQHASARRAYEQRMILQYGAMLFEQGDGDRFLCRN